MSYQLIVRERAENHLLLAYDWYEKQMKNLGSEFLEAIEMTLLLIQKNPLLFQLRHKNIRCAIAPRFPFGIFYFTDKNKIIVVAVFHLSRNPKLWR